MTTSTPSCRQKLRKALPGGSTNQRIQQREQHPPKPSKHSRALRESGTAQPHHGHQQIARVRDCPAPFPKTQKANQEPGHSSSPLCTGQRVAEAARVEMFIRTRLLIREAGAASLHLPACTESESGARHHSLMPTK